MCSNCILKRKLITELDSFYATFIRKVQNLCKSKIAHELFLREPTLAANGGRQDWRLAC